MSTSHVPMDINGPGTREQVPKRQPYQTIFLTIALLDSRYPFAAAPGVMLGRRCDRDRAITLVRSATRRAV